MHEETTQDPPGRVRCNDGLGPSYRSEAMKVRIVDKVVALLMTGSAVMQIISWIGGASGQTAWFAMAAAFFSWMLVLRLPSDRA